jgi:trehalose 6-phosphate synthase
VEPAKNIVRGFDAFELLLDRRKDMRDTRFLACLYGTRNAMPEYQQYLREVRARVAGLQQRYPGSIELFIEDCQDRALGALLCYDVLLVNPLMDGMNLVAKEGAALNERSGVLVLSSGAGAFAELGTAAVGIRNPQSVPETAAALEQALCMPAGRRARLASALRSLVDCHSPLEWLGWQLRDVASIRQGREPAGWPGPAGPSASC